MSSIFKSKSLLVFLLALAYAFMGWVGLALAIPPGYASPVFPAAGLALGCVLWFGPTALAGVWLGSALLNLSNAWWLGTLTPSTAVMAIVISTGSTLQAWVGSWLVRRWQDLAWRTLEREQDIFVFLLLGGALAGVISSLIGVTALQAFGVIQRAEFLFNLWNWYVGDVMGVLVFAPLTLCLLSREGELWRDRRRRIVMPMLLTLGLVALAFYGAARWERQAQDSQLQADSKIVFERIADRVIVHREVLSSLKHFIEATPDFSFKQFELFTRITLQDNPDIFALSFNDLIADEKRPAFESMMSRLSPLGPFQITERNAAKKLVRAMTRPEYVTVRYIVPLANNQPAVGYDIYSEPVRRDAINRARASGAMAVTAPIRLVQEQRQRVGILELLPVTSAPAMPANEQGDRLVGFAVGVVKVDEMIDIATKGHVPAGLVFQLIDSHAPDGQSLLYQSGSPASRNIPLPQAAQWKATLRMGDRDWELSVYTTEDYRRQHRPWMAWVVGVAGLLFAALLQILMLGMTGRTSIIQRKNEAIQASEDRYRSLVETTSDWIWEVDAESRYVYASDKVQEILGYAPEEIIGRTPFDFMAAPEAQRLESQFREIAARRLSFTALENTNFHKNGGTVILETSGVPIFGPNGEFRGYRGMDRDITKRKQAEAALRESEERFSVFMSHLPASAFIKDADGRMVFANRYVQELFGFQNYAGKTTPEIVAGEIALQMTEDDRRALTEGVINVQETIRDSHGKERTFEVLKFPIHTSGKPVRLGGVAIDITALKQIEAALRESEGKYRALIEATSTGFLELDDQGRVLDANAEYVRQTGHSALDEIKLRSVVEWTVAEDRERNAREVQKCLQSGRVSALEIRYVDANDHVTPVEINATTLPTRAGLRILTFSRDITERKHAEAERERLIKELEVRNAELERFTYTVSHDLKSPLITVRGFLGYLEKDALAGNTEGMKADIGRITEAANKMEQLLRELLELSRAGRMMNPPQAVALEEIVREALEVVAGRVKERGVCVEVASGLPVVWGDKLRLVEVMQNLLDNAVKFIGEQPKPVIEVGVRGVEDGKAIVFVRDNGMGIDPRYQEKVFGLFDKLDSQTEGTGVGLALVKRIIETHGGRIWVESEGKGKGSTFCFTVPVQRNRSVPAGGQESPR